MRFLGRSLLFAGVLALTTTAVSGSVGAASRPSSQGGSSQSWIDPTGDAGGAPDVTEVLVSDDPDVVTFNVETPNFAADPADSTVKWEIHIDVDQDRATGFQKDPSKNNRLRLRCLALAWDDIAFRCSQTVCKGDATTSTYVTGSGRSRFHGRSSLERRSTFTSRRSSTALQVPLICGRRRLLHVPVRDGEIPDYQHRPVPAGNGTPKAARPRHNQTKNACVKPARFDVNHNGCSGPFTSIKASVSRANYTVVAERLSRISSFWICLRPQRSLYPWAISPNDCRPAARTFVRSGLISDRTFRAGTTFTVRMTRPGWIGAYMRARVTVASPGVRIVSRLCLQALGGSSPIRCAIVSRGR